MERFFGPSSHPAGLNVKQVVDSMLACSFHFEQYHRVNFRVLNFMLSPFTKSQVRVAPAA